MAFFINTKPGKYGTENIASALGEGIQAGLSARLQTHLEEQREQKKAQRAKELWKPQAKALAKMQGKPELGQFYEEMGPDLTGFVLKEYGSDYLANALSGQFGGQESSPQGQFQQGQFPEDIGPQQMMMQPEGVLASRHPELMQTPPGALNVPQESMTTRQPQQQVPQNQIQGEKLQQLPKQAPRKALKDLTLQEFAEMHRNAPKSQQEKLMRQYNEERKIALGERKEERRTQERIEDKKQEKFDKAYKSNEDFINDTTASYRSFETDMKPRLLQMRNIKDEDLVSPTSAVFLEKLGIPLGALEDPSSEVYNKLSQDLLKGLPETYGNRILKVEVDNFLKTIPTLMNSANGRRMITSNLLKLGEMKEVYYNSMRQAQQKAIDSNEFPLDFQQKVFDQVKPQIDRINNEFVKLSDIKEVPNGTIPFFDPNGSVVFVPKDHAQWAQENGGRRIW